MLKLCGFAVSNYYNKVKLALLEKGVPFTEEINWATKDEATLSQSPLGKVPFLVTEHGPLSESEVINQYIEDAFPARPLLPADPWQRAKIRELTTYLDVQIELVARRLYAEAFFGGKVSEETKEQVRKELVKNLAGLARLVKFGPFVGGSELTLADCAAVVHFPLVTMATKTIYGEDLLAAAIPGAKDYLKMMGARETMQRINADRKAGVEQMAARNKP